MRRPLLVPLVLASAVALAGCASAEPSTESSPDPEATASVDVCATNGGDVVAGVTVAGDFGTAPSVEFATPLDAADETQRAFAITGDGPTTRAGELLQAAYTVYNGRTGDVLESIGYEPDPPAQISSDPARALLGFAKALGCAPVGSRVVAVIPAAETFGDGGNADAGLEPGDAVVLVADVFGGSRAWGAEQPAPEGFPTVTLDDAGAPSVEIPAGDPPADLQVAVLKKGDGAVVGAADTVQIQYQGVAWDSGKVFDESWPTPTSFSLTGVVPGFAQAIAGQTVGSQVIAVIPPALAYGEAGTSSHQLAGRTLVFVIDILGATAG